MQPVIIRSTLLSQFRNLVHGVSTVLGGENNSPFKFNLSLNVGDEEKNVRLNRNLFFGSLNVNEKNVVFQEQVHRCQISYSVKGELVNENDALITDKKNLYLVVNVADCIPILIYEPTNKIIASVHSGWRGTEQEIISQCIDKLEKDFNVDPKELFVYFGPSICKNCFEVGEDVAIKFSKEYVTSNYKKYFVDLARINFSILKKRGLREDRIQTSALCTFELKKLLHSYRRDKRNSGRMFAIIGIAH